MLNPLDYDSALIASIQDFKGNNVLSGSKVRYQISDSNETNTGIIRYLRLLGKWIIITSDNYFLVKHRNMLSVFEGIS